MEMSSFNVGDKAVYPAHGVGEVTGIEKREISGKSQRFYMLKLLDNNMTIMIPTANVNQVGMRDLIDRKDIEQVFNVLRGPGTPSNGQTWNRRQKEYWDKIRSGSVYQIAEVLRDLVRLKYEKELSFGERRLLDLARNLIVQELSIAKGANEKAVEAEIKKIFNT